jgi:ATP-dependent DNA helicase RecQ
VSGADAKSGADPIAAAARALGYRVLREGQHEAVEALVAGRDVLAIMPTGSGKSAIYEIAGALLERPTVVVSPLVALQRDQAQALQQHGDLGAAELHAALGEQDREARLAAFELGELEFLLLAPEQLARTETLARVRRAAPTLLVVDEAHCVSEWGHDFRPAYLALGALADVLDRPRVLALTATAAPPVRDEIAERLGMTDPLVLVRGFDRPNIHLSAVATSAGAAREKAVVEVVEAAERPGIVYSTTRAACERVATALRARGIQALAYHAGQARGRREAVQDAFMDGEAEVVVATIAFGMGVDKPDVRFVVHAQPSSSLDAYWQEVGRAGRDGLPARAILFHGARDLGTVAFQRSAPAFDAADVRAVADVLDDAGGSLPEKVLRAATGVRAARLSALLARLQEAGAVEIGHEREVRLRESPLASGIPAQAVAAQNARRAFERSRLEMMRSYVDLRDCRRGFILNYFGQPFSPPCGACDVCDVGLSSAAPTADAPFAVGARVEHEAFGLGSVQRIESDRIVVLFDERGYTALAADVIADRGLIRQADEPSG